MEDDVWAKMGLKFLWKKGLLAKHWLNIIEIVFGFNPLNASVALI